jgi:hypothetical protein
MEIGGLLAQGRSQASAQTCAQSPHGQEILRIGGKAQRAIVAQSDGRDEIVDMRMKA